ncbi:MAG: ATP-binding cassette domain-containing protein [Actinomycetales bacterium]|nr:ATP-binding cassette domain-containing protein [Actinomycetales bacterium]
MSWAADAGSRPIIRFEDVTITYPQAATPVLAGLDLQIPEGELVLVVGRTGSGKSTLLRSINGLVPHFTGGTLTGRVLVDGRDTAAHPPRELADVVGVVLQDPGSGFVADTVEEELAYGMECLGIPPEVMRRRVEETLDLLGLSEIRSRPLLTLSAGQRQRVAIGAALTPHPSILVLDEPTSALDPGAAEEVLAALQRLVHDLSVTVVLAEHRLERVVQYADRIVIVPGDGQPVRSGTPSQVMAQTPIAPPVVELGRLVGWQPLPLSVRDARRAAIGLRDLLVGHAPPVRTSAAPGTGTRAAAPAIRTDRLTVLFGATMALADVSLEAAPGQIIALMGRNGAGKSTLLASLVGLGQRGRGSVQSGNVRIDGRDPALLRGPGLLATVGLVPCDPADLLEHGTIAEECRAGDRDGHLDPGTTRAVLALLAPELTDGMHPRDLSEGQRLLLALALVLAARPPVLLLDEPTRGLDYPTKARLVDLVRDLAAAGHCVVLATHDVELVAEVATRVIVLADGEVVADGPTADVVVASPMLAPQVAKVLAPHPWLTVSDVTASIGSLLLRTHAPTSGEEIP